MSTLTDHGPRMVCHELPPAEQLPALLRAFDSLAPDASFELASDHAQKAALEHLMRERPGCFKWSPLEEGPERPATERLLTEQERDELVGQIQADRRVLRAACTA